MNTNDSTVGLRSYFKRLSDKKRTLNLERLLFGRTTTPVFGFEKRVGMIQPRERLEVRMAESLSDGDRIRIFRDLLRAVDAIRRGKSTEELSREEEVRWRLEDAPALERYADLIVRLT